MEALVEKVIIGNVEIDITFSYLPSCEDVCKTNRGQGRGEEVLLKMFEIPREILVKALSCLFVTEAS